MNLVKRQVLDIVDENNNPVMNFSSLVSVKNKIGPEYDILKKCEKDDYYSVLNYLNRGGDPNYTVDNKYTLLGVANTFGSLNLIELLLERGADPNFIGQNVPTYIAQLCYGKVPHMPCMRLFIKHEADINLKDGKGLTPLDYAIDWNNKYYNDCIEKGLTPDDSVISGATRMITVLRSMGAR